MKCAVSEPCSTQSVAWLDVRAAEIGSAPTIAGKGIANPLGAISSVAMLLEYSLELPREATKLERAIVKVLSRGYRTPDLKTRTAREKTKERVVSTTEMGELICDYIRMPDAT